MGKKGPGQHLSDTQIVWWEVGTVLQTGFGHWLAEHRLQMNGNVWYFCPVNDTEQDMAGTIRDQAAHVSQEEVPSSPICRARDAVKQGQGDPVLILLSSAGGEQ